MRFDPSADYPLGTKRPELVTTPSGLRLDEITLDALRTGRLHADDVRATPETIRRQAEIARAAGRDTLADNLERAAELASVPAETILEIYTALRPHRGSRADLDRWAERLAHEFSAPRTAAFVREAAAVYEERGLVGGRAAEQQQRRQTL
jgi:propanediol dehydratase small subunit